MSLASNVNENANLIWTIAIKVYCAQGVHHSKGGFPSEKISNLVIGEHFKNSYTAFLMSTTKMQDNIINPVR